jgi:AcrR family transcriptional regulator/DNA-binding MarR family transcriptional regulator
LYVGELQRSRLLEAAFAVVGEQGYQGMTVRRVAERAGVSPKTFYVLFCDREDCFLAAFDHAIDVLGARVRPVYDAEGEWTGRVRGGLGALLIGLDEEPALRRLLFVEALVAGERVLERRAQVLDALAGVVDEGRGGMSSPGELSPLTAEGVVGAVFGVIHARLSQRRPEPLLDLLGALMATIVLPYRGSAAAARELKRPVSKAGPRLWPADKSRFSGPAGQMSGSRADFRLTIRTQSALVAVAQLNAGGANPNNREVSERMGVADQGQVSRLMMRLSEQGLIENTRGHTKGIEKAWSLTAHGEGVLDAHRGGRAPRTETLRGGKLAVKRGRPHQNSKAGPDTLPAEGLGLFTADKSAHPPGRETSSPGRPGENLRSPRGFRLTVRTHLVLSAVAEHAGASNREIANAAGVRDEGQISKLLARLQDRGLIHNTAGVTAGFPKAWQLTPRGEALLHASRPLSERAA